MELIKKFFTEHDHFAQHTGIELLRVEAGKAWAKMEIQACHMNGAKTVHLSEVIGDVPGMALRGISKEFPWPGSRCGWLEVFNKDKHPRFERYVKSLINAKMLEVCSTSLPQYSIPRIMGDPRYIDHLNRRKKMFEQAQTLLPG